MIFTSGDGPIFWAANIAMLLLLLAMLLGFVRLVRGPSLGDRVVALDMITMLTVAFVGVFTVASGQKAYLDVGIGLALVAFLATVAFAWYAEKRVEAKREDADRPARDSEKST
jgi:multicomponent Na+:H+ antiporter subunit F